MTSFTTIGDLLSESSRVWGICRTETMASDNVLSHQLTISPSVTINLLVHSHIPVLQRCKNGSLDFFCRVLRNIEFHNSFKNTCGVLLNTAIHGMVAHELSKSKLIFLLSVKSHARAQVTNV